MQDKTQRNANKTSPAFRSNGSTILDSVFIYQPDKPLREQFGGRLFRVFPSYIALLSKFAR